MEECPRLVADFVADLRQFCSRLETNCSNLRSSIARPPAPPPHQSDPAAIFVDRLNGKVQSLTSRLETLKSVTMGMVSFPELLGHCNELYKKNEDRHRLIEMELDRLGYKQAHETVPEASIRSDDASIAEQSYEAKAKQDIKDAYQEVQRQSGTSSRNRNLTDSSYLESLSLKDLGLSASSLAALTTADTVDDPDTSVHHFVTQPAEEHPSRNDSFGLRDCDGDKHSSFSNNELRTGLLEPVTCEEFNAAPSWLIGQVSMELLNEFVSKLNNLLSLNAKPSDDVNVLKPDDLLSLAYKPQIQKACLLILVKLRKLETGFHDGVTTYAVCCSG